MVEDNIKAMLLAIRNVLRYSIIMLYSEKSFPEWNMKAAIANLYWKKVRNVTHALTVVVEGWNGSGDQ